MVYVNRSRANMPIGGRGRMGGSVAGGPSGNCVCPKCGYISPHRIAEPCDSFLCPKCKTVLTRK